MHLIWPYIAEGIAKATWFGLGGFARWFDCKTGWYGFLGGVFWFLAVDFILLLQEYLKVAKSLDGFKSIFLYQSLGCVMWYI